MPARKCRQLLSDFEAGRLGALEKHPLLNESERVRIQKALPLNFDSVARLGAELISQVDYPEYLARAQDQIPCLFVQGDWSATHRPTIAIVGTRGASNYGKAVAQKFAEAFAIAGLTVVSGGALGIDAAAHKGAIAKGGKTVAVLAGGLDRIYPRIHGGLFKQIAENGCLVSQFGMGIMPERYRFVVRNRLTAALCRAIVVIEAPERSGALSTAGAAAELGREVYVVPSNIENVNFRGSHALIRDGATLVDHPDQVLHDFGIPPQVERSPAPELSELGAKIRSALSSEPINVEKLTESLGASAAKISAELTMLEMEGIVIRSVGGYAVKL